MTRPLAIYATLIASLSALTAAPVPKDTSPPLYFPTAVGAKWVYEKVNGPDETVTVSKVETVGGEFVVSRAGANGNELQYVKVTVSAAGLRQNREDGNGQLVSVDLLRAKFRDGDSWPVPDGGKRTIRGPEPIEVPAGKFTAVKVTWEHDGQQLTSWYAPGVGEIKRVEKIGDGKERVTRLLKSFQPK